MYDPEEFTDHSYKERQELAKEKQEGTPWHTHRTFTYHGPDGTLKVQVTRTVWPDQPVKYTVEYDSDPIIQDCELDVFVWFIDVLEASLKP
jgi:hypothetical protein